MDYFLCVIGMVMIVEGLPYFIAPDRMKSLVRRVLNMEETSMRQFGLFLMVIGLLFVFFGRR